MRFGKRFLVDGLQNGGQKSHPHLHAVGAQILLQGVYLYLFCVEDGRGQTGIHGRVVAEQLEKILLPARAAGGNDGYGAARRHGVQQLQIKAVPDAVRVDGVDNQLPCRS